MSPLTYTPPPFVALISPLILTHAPLGHCISPLMFRLPFITGFPACLSVISESSYKEVVDMGLPNSKFPMIEPT